MRFIIVSYYNHWFECIDGTITSNDGKLRPDYSHSKESH